MIGALFRTMGPFAPPPPPGAQPPPLWGGEDHVRELFGDRVDVRDAASATSLEVTAFARPRDYAEHFKAALRPDDRRPGQRRQERARGRVRRGARRVLRRVEPRHRGRGALRDGVPARGRDAGLGGRPRGAPAAAPASRREATPSLASTAETWWSTVFGEITSACAISALVAPRTIRSSTSVSRGVSPAGPARDAARGPRGIRRTPSARRRRRRCAAARAAPSASKRRERLEPRGSSSASRAPRRARRGSRARAHASAAPAPVAGDRARVRLGVVGARGCTGSPARHSQ